MTGTPSSRAITLVGPTHPFTGGISHHTTALAHHLQAAGHDVDLVSWSSQYPTRLYPGTARVPMDAPEIEPFGRTSYPLAWNRPDSWWRVGRTARHTDLLVLVAATSFHAVPYTVMARAAGRTPSVAIMHNVLPHEARRADRALVHRLLADVDGLVVHSDEQRELALRLGADPATTAVAPLCLPFSPRPGVAAAAPDEAAAERREGPLRLLFFGTVRPYKGLDVLLRAMARVSDVQVTVAGDFWEPVERYRTLVEELGLSGRVDLRPGYVAAEDLPRLFGQADVLALPYRSGTASFNVALAASHGLPVVVSAVGTLADAVKDGVNGLVVPSEDVEALAAALLQMSDLVELRRLSAGVRDVDDASAWATYVRELVDAPGD